MSEYVEAMAERNELYDEAEHRSHINAMVRLMRVGICRSKYWTESRKDYDWYAVLQADKAVAAAIDAGVDNDVLMDQNAVLVANSLFADDNMED